MIRLLAFVGGLVISAQLAQSASTEAVSHVVIPVSDLARASSFYTEALSFVPVETAGSSSVVLHLGREAIELVKQRGRPIPTDSHSNDGWFQHLAIVVSDMDRAYEMVQRAGAVPISTAPQALPAWNPQAGGIRAVYFRDPDGHPLELIQYPAVKGEPRWQEKHRLFLGIDHTAITVADTDASLGFYRDPLGLRVAGASENWGIEQERLSAVPAAHLRIMTLRSSAGLGIELLDYLTPRDGRPIPANTEFLADLWSEETVLTLGTTKITDERLRDPDGHALRITAGEEIPR